MVKCYVCPLDEECGIYSSWLKEGQECVQKMNSASEGVITVDFDIETVPKWYAECPLIKIIRNTAQMERI